MNGWHEEREKPRENYYERGEWTGKCYQSGYFLAINFGYVNICTFFMLLSDFHISYLLSLEYKAFDSQHINRQFIGILNKYFKHI